MLKLPVLVEHFKEHRSGNSNITFTEFIVLHYFSGNPKDKDYDRDQQLPFRTNDVVLLTNTVVVPNQVAFDFTPPPHNDVTYPLFYIKPLTAKHSCGIWQPPKSC
jgi:hypothetical protein